jgi:recombination protein RecT
MSTTTLKAVATGAATGTAVAEKKQDPAIALVEKLKGQMALALPKHMTADRMARIVLTDMRRVPKLMECTQQSLAGAIMAAAQLGLEPGNGLGHAYLLPFDKRAKVAGQWQTVATECQLIIGYRGMIDLARRSGQIVSLSARVVHEKDHFSYRYGLDETVEHVPHADGDPGKMTFVYAVAKLKDGGVQFEVMSRAEVERVREKSKAGSSGPWVDHFEEMAKKTAIRRLFKYLPVSVEMARAVTMDEQAEAGIAQDHNVIDGMVSEMSAPGDSLPPPQDDAAGTSPADEAGPTFGDDTKGQ